MGTVRGGRVVYADALRVTATLAVIVLHIAGSNWANVDVASRAWWTFNLYDGLVRWSVPVFVMLSGMFFLDPGKAVSMKSLFGKSMLRLAVALVFWGTAYLVYASLLKGGGFSLRILTEAVKTVAMGKTHYHLWFLYMMLGMYLITPVLRAFVSGASKRQMQYFLALAFLFASVLPLVLKIYPSEALQTLVNRLQIQMVLGYVGFFVAGYYFHRYKPGKGGLTLLYLLGALGQAVTIYGSYYISMHLGQASVLLYGYMTPNVVFASIALFLLFQNIPNRSEGGGRCLQMLSKCSFGVYLVHDAFIMLYQQNGLTTLSFLPILSVPVLAAMVFLPSLLISFIILKIPVINRYIA